MVRKVFSVFLLSLYIIASLGISGSIHFCGGSVSAIVIKESNVHPCACGANSKMDSSCCSDQDFEIDIEDEHNGSSDQIANVDYDLYSNEVSIKPIAKKEVIGYYKSEYVYFDREPPDIDRCVLYSSFLI